MLDHQSFSALRLRSIFPHDFLLTYPWYSEVGPDSGFDIEYLGGMWEDELIDGVRFWFPECCCTQLGIIELFASSSQASVRPGAFIAYA